MCGISGIINIDKEKVSHEEIERITNIIIHRGPDGHGYYYGDYFAFGHRRLAIVDLSEHGAQPMAFMDRYIITYNGEIYNHIELRSELHEKGYRFSSNCDTEVIMASYDCWGENCLNKFNGMWAFAIYDKKSNKIFCARDRFGVKPFYYTEFNKKFIFSSEIKQFTGLENWVSTANKNRLYDFLYYGIFDHTNETLFENVFQLRGGEKLVFDLGNCTYKVSEWYNIRSKISSSKQDFDTCKEQFKQLFVDAVKVRLRSDVKVGSCLSGGLDSSSIVCVANDLLRQAGVEERQETVSSCFDIKKYDEQEYIDEVVKKTQVAAHKVFPKFDDLFAELDKITWHQDEPFGSTSIFSQWNVFKSAHENNITVMLDGQGADEQLAGYDGFFTANFNGLLRRGKVITLLKEMRAFKTIFGKRKFNPFVGLCYGFISSYFHSIASPIARKLVNGNDLSWIKLNKSTDKQSADRILLGNQKSILKHSLAQIIHTSLPALLHYEDRDSMAHSIESRVPFVDYRIVEFTLGLKDQHKIKDAKTKYILRESMKDVLPERIYNRHDKMGFLSPEEVWIRNNPDIFRKEIEEACDRLGELVDKKKVLTWFDERLDSNKSFGYIFWKLISVGRWIKVFEVKL